MGGYTIWVPSSMVIIVAIILVFNGWNAADLALTQGADGVWSVTVKLDAGQYEYKFVVDGVWLEDNTRLDMHRVKETLDEMQWSGWLVIERSRDASMVRDVVGNFGANTRYLKSIFQ